MKLILLFLLLTIPTVFAQCDPADTSCTGLPPATVPVYTETIPPTSQSPSILTQAFAAPTEQELGSIRKVFIEKMPNDFDQYLRAEFVKQFRGKVVVVLDRSEADAILTGSSEERKGTGAQITGRYMGLHDNATGAVSLLDKSGSKVLWANEAGDRSLWFGALARGGERKVADRLVGKLKKALGY